jgi:SAM-dependent methyltransferase
MDHLQHNRDAWNRQTEEGCRWARPVGSELIRRARDGHPELILTPNRVVPQEWLGELRERDVLCLASGGGQQAPLLAAAGARVVSFDLSEEQLARDRLVAEREGLSLRCVPGDMADLSALGSACFDLIFHPISNVFVPELDPSSLSPRRGKELAEGEAMEFSHSLESQIGGQITAGFVIVGLYEDWWDDEATPLNSFSPTSLATHSMKPPLPAG